MKKIVNNSPWISITKDAEDFSCKYSKNVKLSVKLMAQLVGNGSKQNNNLHYIHMFKSLERVKSIKKLNCSKKSTEDG